MVLGTRYRTAVVTIVGATLFQSPSCAIAADEQAQLSHYPLESRGRSSAQRAKAPTEQVRQPRQLLEYRQRLCTREQDRGQEQFLRNEPYNNDGFSVDNL